MSHQWEVKFWIFIKNKVLKIRVNKYSNKITPVIRHNIMTFYIKLCCLRNKVKKTNLYFSFYSLNCTKASLTESLSESLEWHHSICSHIFNFKRCRIWMNKMILRLIIYLIFIIIFTNIYINVIILCLMEPMCILTSEKYLFI